MICLIFKLILILGMLPQAYTDLQYEIHTIEVQAMSDTTTIAIEQKGIKRVNFDVYVYCIVYL